MEQTRGKGIGAWGISLAVIGGIALAGAGATAAVAATAQLRNGDAEYTAETTGVESIDLNVGGSDMTVRFAPVDEARLHVEDGAGRWTLRRDGDELVVDGPKRVFGWWFGGWFARDTSVTLTLPQELVGVDADLDLGAGSLDVVGDFGDLDVTVGAGGVDVEGSARSLDVDVNAGGAELVLSDVEDAELSVAAGELIAELTGDAPDEVGVDVSAGTLALTLPDEQYAVTQDVSAGRLENRLQTSPQSPHAVHVEVSAGSAQLRPGD